MKNRNIIILAILAFAIMLTTGFFFVVDQTKQVIVLQFGEPKAVYQTPGLKFKLPFIQNVVYYDSRVLNLDPAQEEVILRDQKRVVVDTIVRYIIKDPLKFFQTTRTELALIDRLGRIINSSVRGVISKYYLDDLLSETRNKIMSEILINVKEDEKNFGIEIVDLRLKRTELTNEVQSNVFDRMKTEREREANLLRAEGQEISQKIKATADRQKIEIVAEADKQSNILRGTGEAARNKILNDAFARDPDFFEFIRSMEAYTDTFKDGSTTMVISPDSDFFKFFENSNGFKE
ncbi:MAG: protease modulator HflC [Proteobacteria bacterium]|nr:protease modulator HflC [Pseudomonadota bacterium]